MLVNLSWNQNQTRIRRDSSDRSWICS